MKVRNRVAVWKEEYNCYLRNGRGASTVAPF